jgi:hypothetical protein
VRYNTAVWLAGGGGQVPIAMGKPGKQKFKMANVSSNFSPEKGSDVARS